VKVKRWVISAAMILAGSNLPAHCAMPYTEFYIRNKESRTAVRQAIVQNDLVRAQTLAEEAYRLAVKNSTVPEDALAWQHEIAQLQGMREHYSAATQTYCSALEQQHRVHGVGHALTEITYNDMGQAYVYDKKFDAAFEAFCAQRAILERIFDANHIGLAQVNMDLGRVSFLRNDLPNSIAFYQKAISLLNQDPEGNRLMLCEAQRELSESTAKLASISTGAY
jgi:tetratricopeptide (TPR) repeat protein